MRCNAVHTRLFIILVSVLFCSVKTLAQEINTRVHFGIAAPIAVKLPLLGKNGKYGLWGNAGISLVTVIEGAEEGDPALQLRTGFTLDFSRYKIPGQGGFTMDRGNLYFNPEVVLPLHNPRLKVSAGFGVEWDGYFLAQPDDGSVWTADMQEQVDDSRRKATPFLSGGIQFELIRDIWLQLFLRQALMNAFRGETVLTFGTGTEAPRLDLRQQPTFLGFCFSYFF